MKLFDCPYDASRCLGVEVLDLKWVNFDGKSGFGFISFNTTGPEHVDPDSYRIIGTRQGDFAIILGKYTVLSVHSTFDGAWNVLNKYLTFKQSAMQLIEGDL